VSVFVSTGIPEPILAPDLVGLPVGDVNAALQKFSDDTGIPLGWVVEHITVDDAGLWGIVIGTEPPPGSPIEGVETIKVIVGRQPSP
jgi:beta-lactam-binding protein with PASTA domain